MLHSKFWQAFFALAPLIMVFLAIIGYFIFLFSLFARLPELENSGNISASLIMGEIGIFVVFVFLTVLLSIGSLIFYIIHASQNPNLRENNLLLLWILLFVFVSGIGQLIYWILEILGKRKKPTLS